MSRPNGKRPNKGGKRIVPQPGGESFQVGVAGPPTYHLPMPPPKTRLRLVAGGKLEIIDAGPPMSPEEWRAHCEREGILFADRPLVPASEEVAKLPRTAREAFAARCAARVAKLRQGAHSPEAAAALILAAATVGTPIRKQLLCIRRDFDRIARLAREQGWTDDTPVPPEVFDPMWPEGLTPEWAKESHPPAAPAAAPEQGG
jgi:hypothetical protein